MGVFLFTDKPALIKSKVSKTVITQSLKALSKYPLGSKDIAYVDVTGIEGAEIIKLLAQAKENSKISSSPTGGSGFLSGSIKLPAANAFPGWKKIKSGTNMPFYLLYCSIEGKTPLDARYNEKTVAAIHKNFTELLQDYFHDADGLLWMNSGRDCLFLIPAKQKYVEHAVKACMKMLISAPLCVLDYLDLPIQVNFVFALHYGFLKYKPPGQTGTVVSDAINFVFHLGAKKAESGRLTVSGDLPGVSIPKELLDCFVPVKDFEGRKIWHTKKFEYPKSWV